ncbi:fungal specific transcription factor domain-containing protein [Aspergillus undulatus]|uniref:fungal specific transcription factor domain-containing protein n=1 Tax=Aspergillus undulatus TaxID=1810928 RepID=UPI003CCD0BE2
MARAAHEVFLEAYEIFCVHYHSKPYTLFNPDLFRRRIDQGLIPRYLQFSFIATAVRFSSQLEWKQRKQKTIDAYARCSWEMIMSEPDGLGNGSDIAVIQALALLAIIDATAGRRRAAWVKIGMAVRISQDLEMMLEPDDGLPVEEREERRNLFWSLFLLDRFVCCSFRRPPAIKVSDCLLKLPVSDPLRGTEISLTLGELLDERVREESSLSIGLPGLSVGLAALLGRTIDCMMNSDTKGVEPWQSDSDYSAIARSLEALKEMTDQHIPGNGHSTKEGEIRLPRGDLTSHFILSLTLYHLAHCILSHPFLLGMKRETCQSPAPAWFDAQYASCWGHSQALTTLIADAKAAGYMLAPSFCSYCVLVAGTVHAILLYCEDKPASERAARYLSTSLGYLSEVSEMWQNAYIMTDALRFFTNRCVRYSGILLGAAGQIHDLTPTDITVLRSVLDYWIMMDPENPISQLSSVNIDCFPRTPGLTNDLPSLSPGDVDTSGSDVSKAESHTVNPGDLIDLPISRVSSVDSDADEGLGGSLRWDWGAELASVLD